MAAPHLCPEINANISSYDDLNYWLTTASKNPGNICFLRLDQTSGNWIQAPTIVEKIATTFPNVESLVLVNPDLTSRPSSNKPILYAPFEDFSKKLTSLSLEDASQVDPLELLRFISMFRELENLRLDEFYLERTSSSTRFSAIGPRFRGKLTLSNIDESYGTCMITSFPRDWMAFEEVCLRKCSLSSPGGLKRLFDACKETVKKVEISQVAVYGCNGPRTVDLSPLNVLKEVRFGIASLEEPVGWVEAVLGGWVHDHIRKVTFDTENSYPASAVKSHIDPVKWVKLDWLFEEWAYADPRPLEIVFNVLMRDGPGVPYVDPGDEFLKGSRKAGVTVRFRQGRDRSDLSY